MKSLGVPGDGVPGADGPPFADVLALFDRRVRDVPGAPAIVCGAEAVTYADLAARSRDIARHLRSRGVGAGDRIAICLGRSIDAVAAILGVLRAGAVYVPVDTSYPAERIAFLVRDSGASRVIAQHDAVLEVGEVPVSCLEEIAISAAADTAHAVSSHGSADLAYLIYTSGSTGRPKGVAVTRANLAFSTAARLNYYRSPVSAYLLVSSLSFDSSVAGLFWTLGVGGMLVLPEPREERDPALLARLIERHSVSHLLALPALYRLILKQHRRSTLDSLQVVIVAGEACPASVADEHRQVLPHAAFYNEYGPTEASVWTTVHEVTGHIETATVPIGRPIPGSYVHVIKEDGGIAAAGEIGELWIGGPGVAAGYHERPELTAAVFVADPFRNGQRVYRTGDLVRARPDGTLDFVGRRDQQVKVRGYRVELGEIEAAIATHESVAEAIVSALEDPNGNRLVAHVVPKPLRSIDPARLRAFLADRLPDHFLPSAVQVIADLPRSPNGKVDRNALSASAPRRDGLQQSYVAPAGAIEEWLAHEWSAVLGLPTVGRHDPFFELGGTSIQAAEIVTRLQQRLDEFVFVVLMFECPTISELASRLRRDYADALGRLFPSEVPRNVRGAGKARSTLDESRLVEVARRLYRAPIRAAGRTNPPAVFILAPPRSGTTLLAAMLGGHPDLFVAPELNLFGFDRMGHRRDECQDAASVWLDGTIRAVMNIYGLSADDAVARVKRAEHANVTVAEQVAALQSAIAPRLLVDKSPAYGLRLETLRQIEATVRSARYVHLSRHPAAMIRSFAEHHMDQIYLNGDTLPPREAGEAVWVITHRNILQFLGSVASDRQVHVRYEDLVLEPEREMHRVSDALGREFHAAMLNPYGAGSCERLAGVHPQSKPLGDPRFLTFNRITDERIQDTRNRDEIESLGAPARSVARSLGYDLADSDTPSEVAGAYARARHMRASLQRRLAGRKAGSPSRTDA